MKEEPKVLTRMRLSCCWGDNLNEKELNEVVDYINNLQSQLKAKEEVIKEARKKLKSYITFCENDSQGAYEVCNMAIRNYKNIDEILSKGGKE